MAKKEENHRYESVTLGVPPLKMILVELDSEKGNKTLKKTSAQSRTKKELENRQTIMRLIDYLTGIDN